MRSPRHLRYLALALGRKRNATPVYLIHHVTDHCNAKCRHCFIIHDGNYAIPDGVSGGSLLTIEEIADLTKHLGPNLYTVQITGGEPLLRADLLAIVRAYYSNSAARYVQVCTNGMYTDRIVSLGETVLGENPNRRLGFVISVDDIGSLHDENRGVPGMFDALAASIRGLQALQKHFSGLQVSVNVTATRFNQDRLLLIYERLQEMGVSNVLTTLVRGNPADTGALGVDPAKYSAFVEKCADGWFAQRDWGFRGLLEAPLVNAQNILTHRRNVERISNPDKPQVCYAGLLSAVIYADGSVALCEEEPYVIGNVRDWSFDFVGLWRSAAANRVRAWKSAIPCVCTHECFAICNVLFNPRDWPAVAAVGMRRYLSL